ncbi:MAG TPA: hypothetical protein VFA47_06655 [Candidatus Manganitrophaceae bacterium]|nr:hypothetical protein [Candidatus Manganitrophaceae bacterium]
MNTKNEHEVEQLKKEAPEVDLEISLAADETMVYEAVQEVKGKVAEFIAKYEHVMTELSPKDQKELMRTIGLKVEEMEEKLTEIRQAPE